MDGHCFMHSILSAIQLQAIGTIAFSGLNMSQLISMIKKEAVLNENRYLQFFVGMSRVHFFDKLDSYFEHKLYDSYPIDLIPLITSNALQMDVGIITKDTSGVHSYQWVHCDKNDADALLVYKYGDHYDGLAPIGQNPANGNNNLMTSRPRAYPVIQNYCYNGNDIGDQNLSNQETSAQKTESTIKIISWNIHGLNEEKLSQSIIGGFLKTFDTVLLTETWSIAGQSYGLTGFQYHDFCREYKHSRARRGAGGQGVFIRNEISKGVDKIRNHKDIIVWLKLKKSFFGLTENIMIGSVYVYPEDLTCVDEDQFVLFQRELCNLPCHDSHILCGDFNARTNVANDYIVERNYGSDGQLSELLDDNSHSQTQVHTYLKNYNILERYSMDRRPMNRHGSRLIELCKTSNMFILNGRCGRDYGVGRYTRVNTMGSSVIDYVLCTAKVHQRITEFQVGNKMPESDHNPVTFSIKLNSPVENIAKLTNTWTPVYKYKWNQDGLDKLGHVLHDNTSENFKEVFYTSVLLNANVDTVATSFMEYFGQACYRAYGIKRVNQKRQSDPNWFDAECRAKRNEAIKAGAHVESDADRDTLVAICKQYRSPQQQKKRAFSKKCASEIESGFQSSTTQMWHTLSRLSKNLYHNAGPSGDELVAHYESLAKAPISVSFDNTFENEVLDFLHQYDTKCVREPIRDRLEFDILNENITVEEIESAIDSLKNNKTVGIDMIPAEFIKFNKGLIVNDLCILLNNMIEQEEFPDSWAEVVRSSIHKSGPLLDPKNHRGITVLPIFEKVFEIIAQRRLEFINEAFMRKDRYNGGFLKGSQTADNLFILQSLIERQLALGQNLIVCFIDFSRAFDLMNRNILFYKLIKSGLHGRVINTLRNLYTKTYFRVKQGGYLSDLILQEVGVNQGGNASPIIFRKYLSDLRNYLNEKKQELFYLWMKF